MRILDWIRQKISGITYDKGHPMTYTVSSDILMYLAYNHFLTSEIINLETHTVDKVEANIDNKGGVKLIMVIKERETPPPPPPPAEKTTPPTENNNQSDNTPSQKSL